MGQRHYARPAGRRRNQPSRDLSMGRILYRRAPIQAEPLPAPFLSRELRVYRNPSYVGK